MSCSNCGNSCSSCNPCNSGCEKTCCKNPCLNWGFDGCFLRGRCADGTELNPLNLCEWLDEHETCTSFRLIPNGDGGSYMEFMNECGESQKLYVCDFLSLGTLECLGNVVREEAQPCDLLVFSPECGIPGSKSNNKWTHYHIPDAGDCVMEADDDGYYRPLIKNECGCIVECRMLPTDVTYEYGLRDAWPDDPDWPFSIGSRTGDNSEIIDLNLQRVPMFGKSDLEVTVQYAYGIQNTTVSSTENFKSMVTPTYEPTHNPTMTDKITNTWTVQAVNSLPWGSGEWQVTRTLIVPKGKNIYLTHIIEVRNINGQLLPYEGETTTAPTGKSSRLHALRVIVKPTKGVRL